MPGAVNTGFVLDMQRKLYRWSFDHPWQSPRMESRMQGNLHVRFGEGDEETCPSNGIKRFIPTLPARHAGPALGSGTLPAPAKRSSSPSPPVTLPTMNPSI